MRNHEIDYKIYGDDMQFVEVELDPNETVVAEAGSLMMMDQQIEMETIFGDGSGSGGGLVGKLFGAGKRLLTGESLFMTTFTNIGHDKKHVSFASPYPGKIIPMNLSQNGGKIICQKDAFLAAAKGVSVGVEFQRKLGAGFSAEKASSCRSLKETEWHLSMRAERYIRESFSQEKSLKSTPAALLQ